MKPDYLTITNVDRQIGQNFTVENFYCQINQFISVLVHNLRLKNLDHSLPILEFVFYSGSTLSIPASIRVRLLITTLRYIMYLIGEAFTTV